MMSLTTSIHDLPSATASSASSSAPSTLMGGPPNVSYQITETNDKFGSSSISAAPLPPNQALDQQTIQELVKTLQQASSTGVTQLRSRDIPINTESITHDEQIKPNYIPGIDPLASSSSSSSSLPGQIPTKQVTKSDNRAKVYFSGVDESTGGVDDEDVDEIVSNDMASIASKMQLTQLYSELQYPLFVGLLYFMFQLPIVRKTLVDVFPDLCHLDGNVNLYGTIMLSLAFAIAYHFLFKLLHLF